MMIRRFAAASALAIVALGAGTGVASAAATTTQPSPNTSSILANIQRLLGIDHPQFDLMGDTQSTRPTILPTGENAVKRVLALEEQKAGHKLMNIQFLDGKRAHISFAPQYDFQKDNDALVKVSKALELNGYSVTVDR